MSINYDMSRSEIARRCSSEAGEWLSIAKVSESKARANDWETYGGLARAMAEGWALHAALLWEDLNDVH